MTAQEYTAPAPAGSPATWRLAIAGLGNVGAGLLRILRDSRDRKSVV